jgi:hypothetical protein
MHIINIGWRRGGAEEVHAVYKVWVAFVQLAGGRKLVLICLRGK